jgi:hypothetical protein
MKKTKQILLTALAVLPLSVFWKVLFKKTNRIYSETFKRAVTISVLFFLFSFITQFSVNASMRRTISPSQPMLLIHIDAWNYADPQKVIDLIPADIRPYVVMNISLSINHDATTGAWKTVEYGYETAKSWLRTCAENRMWAMIQPASGGYSQLSDTDLTVYKEFFENYPNFIGFNYAEQFWGFDDATDPISPAWTTRIAHFVDLINLADTYGGYLCVSWCGAYYGAGINPVAMLKKNSAFASVLQTKSDHFIMCEKFTSKYGFYDIESTCLGTYLSGYCGQYGIRFDQCGWSGGENSSGDASATFPVPAGIAPIVEHPMLTGQTVIDGPELIWSQCIQSLSNGTTSDGYTTRKWGRFPQFDNISIDVFRKILDGTIRIMTRKEVINRTKVVIVQDVASGTDVLKYSAPVTLFDSLYKTNGSGSLLENRTWFKRTGRYPAVPTVFALNGTDANSFSVQVNASAYSTRWATSAAKQTEFNSLFTSEYTGTIYAGRNENGWVIYNPYKTGVTASGNIPFKYNTCTSMDVTLSQYTVGVVKEISNKVTYYLNNYDNTNTAFKTDIIKINGCSSQPTYSYTDRGSHTASTITTSYSSGVFTINVSHNGSLDITVNCSGTATGRLTSYTTATLSSPTSPAVYAGPRQYEAENFDYKNIAGNVAEGYNTGIANYTAMGYLKFGTSSAASIRDTVKVTSAGTYLLTTKYTTVGGNVSTIDLYVNGTKVATPTFTAQTSTSTWGVNNQMITLQAGANTIEFRANATGARTIYFDNIIISLGSKVYDFTSDAVGTSATTPPALNMAIGTSNGATAGVVSYTDANSTTSNMFRAYSSGERNGTGVVDLGLFPTTSTDYSITWKQCVGTSAKDYKVGVLLRGGNTVATTTTGYVAGMRQGYLFIVYTANGATTPHTEFRIYNSSSATSLSTLVNMSVSALTPGVQTPIWYRASVSGTSPAVLKLEYSTNNSTWTTGATYSDTTALYTNGATQVAWGLAAGNWDFYLDDISYYASSAQKSAAVTNNDDTDNSSKSAVISKENATIVSKEYFTLTGQKVYNVDRQRGIFIVRNHMSDGSVTTSKILKE